MVTILCMLFLVVIGLMFLLGIILAIMFTFNLDYLLDDKEWWQRLFCE